jgi:hypothetical protein
MIQAAWDLGSLDRYADLNLRRWAHLLGFRGHFLTKSRAYSTTFKTLRDDAERELAAAIADRTRQARQRKHRREHGPTVSTNKLWGVKEVAEYLGVPEQTLYQWRTRTYGPPGRRVGKYRPADGSVPLPAPTPMFGGVGRPRTGHGRRFGTRSWTSSAVRQVPSWSRQLWLAEYRADAENGIYSLSSVDTYSDHLKNHVLPTVGDLAVDGDQDAGS